jgi:hypothetical protein
MVPGLRHVAILTAAAVLSSASAYAGARVARNSVGSPQVINNSLTGADVRNHTLGRKDLKVGATPRTYTVIRSVPAGSTEVLDIPGFSRFTVSCSATSIGMTASFGDADPTPDDPTQQHGIAGSDIIDSQPAGGVTITGFGGGVGFTTSGGAQPGAGVLVRGDYWGRSETLLAHGTWSWGFPSVPCLFRLQVVVTELRTPVPVARPLRGPDGRGTSTCDVTGAGGAAYCLEP